MFRKSTILALTAFAALGLAVSNASAKPQGRTGKVQAVGNPGIIKQIARSSPSRSSRAIRSSRSRA